MQFEALIYYLTDLSELQMVLVLATLLIFLCFRFCYIPPCNTTLLIIQGLDGQVCW
ncbi:hypothetical protein RchiOBHm_Chr6g0272181 [Rosa chinensis]|uniref:Uncharacterized protein n=1 Tax=Rosa chinensis TaxID=74649 RepID=A0A2P6PR51_ROSCH|nr:hypothetical protein RchiOBHm_Chr6g0272181 [Rosa chinensis]